MTLRLVDKDNVFPLPVDNLRDVAVAARGFADAVDDGLDVESAILISKVDGRIEFTVFGENVSIAEGLGMIELTKAKIIAGAWN